MGKRMDKVFRNEWFCFGLAVLGAWLVTGLLLLLLSFLIYRLAIPENMIAIGILLIYVAGNLFGGFVAGKGVFGKHYLAGMIVGGIYFLLLLLLSLLVNHTIRDFGGNFFTTLAICIGSGTLGGMFSGMKKKKL